MCPGTAHSLGALRFPVVSAFLAVYLGTCVFWLCCSRIKSVSEESMFSDLTSVSFKRKHVLRLNFSVFLIQCFLKQINICSSSE